MRADTSITAGSRRDKESSPAAAKVGQRGLGILNPQHRWSETWAAGDHTVSF